MPTSGRVRPGQQPCVGVWPITGNACKNPAEDGYDTCLAHDPDGDKRWPPPPDEQRCTATNKESGERCRNGHGPGGKVCGRHGGGAPQTRTAAETRVIEGRALRLVNTYGRKVQTTATQALIDEVQWTAGHVEWLRERVQELEEVRAAVLDPGEGGIPADSDRHPLVWGITKIKEGGEDAGTTYEAAASIWLQLYWKEREHLVKVCAATVKAGVDERLVKLAEDQGRLVADVLRAILGDLNLSPEQHARAYEVAPRHLRALTARTA